MKNFLDKYHRVLVPGFAFATLVLTLFSLTLVGQIVSLHNELEEQPEDLTVEGAEEQNEINAEQEAYISSLESENKTLRERIDELIEASQEEGNENIVVDENEALRREVRELTEEFSHAFLNRSDETDDTRRERLEPYTDLTILNAFAPEDSPYLDFISQEGDEEFEVDPEEVTSYEVAVEELTIYHDEASFDADLIDVYVIASTSMTMNDNEPTNEDIRLSLKIENNDGDLIVTNVQFNYED